tara:strand:+ start:111 stop:413 length:303 start_codon:yes stop_codon:yes gene_type:complete
MQHDHEAIRKAYPEVVTIRDGDNNAGAFDKDNNKITLDQSKVDAARATLDTEAVANAYQEERKRAYPSIREQLDYIYHNGIDKWKTDIVDPVKSKYPKPS